MLPFLLRCVLLPFDGLNAANLHNSIKPSLPPALALISKSFSIHWTSMKRRAARFSVFSMDSSSFPIETFMMSLLAAATSISPSHTHT